MTFIVDQKKASNWSKLSKKRLYLAVMIIKDEFQGGKNMFQNNIQILVRLKQWTAAVITVLKLYGTQPKI